MCKCTSDAFGILVDKGMCIVSQAAHWTGQEIGMAGWVLRVFLSGYPLPAFPCLTALSFAIKKLLSKLILV